MQLNNAAEVSQGHLIPESWLWNPAPVHGACVSSRAIYLWFPQTSEEVWEYIQVCAYLIGKKKNLFKNQAQMAPKAVHVFKSKHAQELSWEHTRVSWTAMSMGCKRIVILRQSKSWILLPWFSLMGKYLIRAVKMGLKLSCSLLQCHFLLSEQVQGAI